MKKVYGYTADKGADGRSHYTILVVNDSTGRLDIAAQSEDTFLSCTEAYVQAEHVVTMAECLNRGHMWVWKLQTAMQPKKGQFVIMELTADLPPNEWVDTVESESAVFVAEACLRRAPFDCWMRV